MTRTALALALTLACGCAAPGGPMGTVGGCGNCGTVRSVDLINQAPQTTGAGAVLGAVIGGVIGHQFGSGRGKDAATAGGAVAGAVIGNEQEKQNAAPTHFYRVLIDMDNGYTESLNVADPRGIARGSRVRVVGRNLELVQG